MSTRILSDNEFTHPGDAYCFVNARYGHGVTRTLEVGSYAVSELPGWILREVNASCRCLDETEPMRSGDVAIVSFPGQKQSEIIVGKMWLGLSPSYLWGWAGEHPWRKCADSVVVAVVRYEK
jgi:hypothetical protein